MVYDAIRLEAAYQAQLYRLSPQSIYVQKAIATSKCRSSELHTVFHKCREEIPPFRPTLAWLSKFAISFTRMPIMCKGGAPKKITPDELRDILDLEGQATFQSWTAEA
jgi:hypothetical protein